MDKNKGKPKKGAAAGPSISKSVGAVAAGLPRSVVGLANQVKDLLSRIDLLTHERDLMKMLFDTTPDCIYFKDYNNRFIMINRALAQLFGLSDPAEAIGRTDFDFFTHEHAEQAFKDEQNIIRTGEPIIAKQEKETWPDRPDTWVLSTKLPFRNKEGEIVGTCGISRNVTSLILAEDALERERNLLRLITDNIPDRIFIKDTKSRFLFNNKAHLEMIGILNEQGAIGKTDFDQYPRELAARYFSDEQLVLQTGRAIKNREEPSVDTSGNRRWLSTTKVAVRDSLGTITGLVGISRDITDRKRSEEELRRAKEELELRVQERTADLKEANEQLQKRLEQLKFLNTTSYQLAQFIRIDELCPSIVDSFIVRFPRAEGILCLRDGDGFSCGHATELLDTESDRTIAKQAVAVYATTDLPAPYLVDDWKHDEQIGAFPWQGLDHLPVYLAIPLLADNRTLGIMQIFTIHDYVAQYRHETEVLMTLSAQAASCLSNAMHYQDLGEQARMLGELDAARSIQQRFVPQEKPVIPHVNLKSVYYPAFEVGGDYLDYFQADNGNWVVVVADVCGKGVPAALFMTMLRSAFRIVGRAANSARQMLCAVNDAMKANLDDKSFVTAVCLVIDSTGTNMTYARAGHPMMVHLKAGGAVDALRTGGLALGLVHENAMFASMIDELSIPLVKGDRFLLYTDGLTEATDIDKSPYTLNRLLEMLAQERSDTPEALIDDIMADNRTHTHGLPPHDDLTILALCVQ